MACDVCDQPTTNGLVLCTEHREDLLGVLARTPALLDDLDVTISRQDRIGRANTVGRSAEKPMPYGVVAADRGAALVDVLCRWAGQVAEVAGVPSTDQGRQAARVLAEQIPTVCRLDHAGQCYDDITRATADALASVDLRPDRGRYLGQCGYEADDGAVCLRDLFAVDSDHTVVCPDCGCRWEAEARRAWLLGIIENDLIGTARQCAEWLCRSGRPISLSSIFRWIAREKLKPVPALPGATPTYRFADAVQVYDHRARPGTRTAA